MKGLRFPGIDGQKFSRLFIMKRGQRELAKFLNAVGPERFGKLVAEKRPLAGVLPQDQMAQYRQLASQFHWIANVVSDQDFLSMLPPWCLEVVAKHGPEGEQWLAEQLVWLRSLFTPPS